MHSLHTFKIKEEARRLGFEECGITKAEFLENEARNLEDWLNQGKHGKMSYLEKHFDLRTDPRKLVPGAKTVITLSYNYFTDKTPLHPNAPKISRYAYGKDYHLVIKEKLNHLFTFMKDLIGDLDGRCFVDSAPVMERAWAARSGIGWTGKNSLTLTKGKGSFFFLGTIISDADLIPDGPVKDYCGSCTKCIEACPTGAITEPYSVDGSKCISYFTIELKDALLPEEQKGKFQDWMFGCDVCQDVCPINARSKKHNEIMFEPSDELLSMNERDWRNLSEEKFKALFRNSPIKRTGYTGLMRNIRFLYNN